MNSEEAVKNRMLYFSQLFYFNFYLGKKKERHNAKGLYIYVPLITMLHHKSLKLDEARIKLNVKTQLIGDQLNVEVDQIASNEEGLGCDRQQIELVFKPGEPAEWVARINQSAKYEIYARAAQQAPTEGMNKLTSIFASVMEPVTVESK